MDADSAAVVRRVGVVALALLVAAASTAIAIVVLARSPTPAVTSEVPLARPLIGAKVSYTSNRLSTNEPISFDTVEFDGGGFFDSAAPDRLTVQTAGCYFVEAQITILGWGYGRGGRMTGGNPPSPNFSIEIRRNGNATDFVAAENRTDEDAGTAQIGHAATVECFEVGDYVQLFVTGNRLVESNWPRTGGSLSPVLLMAFMGTHP